MPKLKPHKGLLKRATVTGRGKVKFKRPNAGHLNSGKPGSRIMRLRRRGVAKAGNIRQLEHMVHQRLTPAE